MTLAAILALVGGCDGTPAPVDAAASNSALLATADKPAAFPERFALCADAGIPWSRTLPRWQTIVGGVADDRGGAVVLTAGLILELDRGGNVSRELALGEGVGAVLARHGDTIAVGGYDRGDSVDDSPKAMVSTWDLSGSGLQRHWYPEGESVTAVAFDREGQLVAAVDGGPARGVDLLHFDSDGAEVARVHFARMARAPMEGDVGVSITAVAPVADGSLLVGGTFSGTLVIDGQVRLQGRGMTTAFVTRLDRTGRVLFLDVLSNDGDYGLRDVRALQVDDGFFVVHQVDDAPPGPFQAPSNAVLTRLDQSGKGLWQKTFRHDVQVDGLALDAGGRVVLSGVFAGAVDFGAGVVRGDGDGFVVGIDNAGTAIYTFTLDGIHGAPVPTSDGGVLVAGSTNAHWAKRQAALSKICPPSIRTVRTDEPPIQRGFPSVALRYALDEPRDGIDGRLELVADSRTPVTGFQTVNCFFWAAGRGLGEGYDTPPIPASVRLVDADGTILDTLQLEHPMATMEPIQLYGTPKRTFGVTVHDWPCWGRFRGFITRFYEVRDRRLHELVAYQPDGSRPAGVVFVTGLSGMTRMVSSDKGPGKDILHAYVGWQGCRLWRYSFETGRWVERMRDYDGTEVLENRFPDHALFPRATDGR